MADSIIVKYEADLSGIKAQLTELKNANLALTKQVGDFGAKAKESSDKAATSVSTLGNQFDKLGKQIAAAFSVAAVIAFGKASLAAFAEAELSARKLNAAIGAGGGTQSQLQTLINQSKELQKVTIFSDEQIQSAQTLALQFGLTGTEVEKLIPKIVDFASATGQDLQSALTAVLNGTNGVARGLKVYGVEVDANATKSERLTQITDQLTQKFGGQAQEVGETTTGAFRKLQNAFNDLQESIGAILARGGGFLDFLGDITEGLARFFKTDEEAEKEINLGLTEQAKQSALKTLEELQAKFKASGRDVNDAFKVLIDESNAIIIEAQKRANATFDLSIKEKSKKEIELEKARIQAITDVQNDEIKIRQRTINEGAEAAAKAADKAREDAIKNAKEVSDAQLALAKFTFDEENKNIDLRVAQDKLKASELIDNETDLQAELLRIDEAAQLERIQSAKDTIQPTEALEVELTNIHIKQNELKKKSDRELQEVRESIQDELIKQADELGDRLDKIGEDEVKARRQNFEDIFSAAQDLTNSLNSLFHAQTEEELSLIEERKTAQTDAIDAQIAVLEEANNKGRLSDRKLEIEKKKLLEQRVAAEKRAAEEEKKIKRKQAEDDKLLTLFRLALALAEAIAAPPPLNVFRIIAATAALAFAAATPIPSFAKGTKGKKGSGMARVGEQGEEFMFVPDQATIVPHAQTKKHKEALDAMIDNRFEDYVYKAMIAPAIMAATKKMEKDRQKSFAENVANSFFVNKEGMNEYRMLDALQRNNKGNAEAIARALAKYINNNPNDRYYH